MAKIQSRNSSTKSTKHGTSAPKAPSFTKEQSAYVAGLLTGRGMGASGGGTGFMPVSGDVYDPGLAPVPAPVANNAFAPEVGMQPIDQIAPFKNPLQEAFPAPNVPQTPAGYYPADRGSLSMSEIAPLKHAQEVNPFRQTYGTILSQAAQKEIDAQREQLMQQIQASRGVETYDPALEQAYREQVAAKDPILTEGPKWYDSIYDGMDQLLSGKAFKEQNERYSVDPAKVGEVDMISSATNTVSAAREPKPNPAQGKIETPADAATYWATELPAWLKPKIAYDENNEPYVTMHAAVMQRMMIASMYGGMAQNSRNNADRIEQEAMQGVSPEVVQGTHDAQYTINQLAQNAPRGTQHTGPYGYGQQQYAVTTAQGSPYEASFVKMLQQIGRAHV